MDEGTQQNAALVEEASASARSLEQQAEQLVQTVAAFHLEEEPAPVARLAPRLQPVQQSVAVPLRAPAVAKPRPARRAVASGTTQGDTHWQEF